MVSGALAEQATTERTSDMAGLTDDQKRHYEEQGYVFLRQLFAPNEIQPLIDEIDAAVAGQAQKHYDGGRLGSPYDDHGFETRFMKMVEDCGEIYNELVGSALMGPELFKILSSPQLVDIAEGIVGPEVHCEGRHRLRPKLPNYGVADYRWHEDTLYQARRLTYVQRQYGLGPTDKRQSDVYLSRIVAAPQMAEPGFWIPLVDVDEVNGCLSLLPGGHHHSAVYDWQWRSGDFVPELDGLTPLPMPMQVGDALLIHQHLPHVSPPNRSDGVRWSVDIRYQDGRLRVKSVREPGFLARSKERPEDVVTTHEGYARIRAAVKAFAQETGIRL